MDERITVILKRMFGLHREEAVTPVVDLTPWLTEDADPLARVTATFLLAASGADHPVLAQASEMPDAAEDPAASLESFYRRGLELMSAEMEHCAATDAGLSARLDAAALSIAAATDRTATTDAIWEAFFPEAAGVRAHEEARIAALRAARTVSLTSLAADPLSEPAREVLFTSNILLTVPASTTHVAMLPYSASLRAAIEAAAAEPQRYWFDHPIQIGVEPEANELLYGLRGLDEAIEAEGGHDRVTCLLSVSVTHHGLGAVARPYVEAELEQAGGLRNIDVIAVTEEDVQQLVSEVIVPALSIGLGETAAASAAPSLQAVVGVDGEYGRHYSFLKAVSALWHVAIDPAIRATFKIDLDQVFPQQVLVEETGQTMFGHLATPLWGATGLDSEGREIELGMIAGALVNERDIGRGLFTPDVDLPIAPPTFDEHVFYSVLPQAISTRAEMMERYDGPAIDGIERALERIHVTGGTNGIRVDALRRHRPFTPSFVGRAEDQAYILSTLGQPGPRLAYAHAAGLIMRHDKEAFAGEAMAAAHVGKLIGDDVRILLFSAYADAAAGSGLDGALDRAAVGRLLDPFTGSFVSAIPQTLVLLRLALRTLHLFAAGEASQAREYAIDGSRRLAETIEQFGDIAAVAARVAQERLAWDHYYEALEALEAGMAAGDARYGELAERAVRIIDGCRISTLGPGPR